MCYRSRATVNILYTKASCAFSAARPAGMSGNRSPKVCRRKTVTSMFCGTPCPWTRSTSAEFILARPVDRSIAHPMPATVGRRLCAICRQCCRSRCRPWVREDWLYPQIEFSEDHMRDACAALLLLFSALPMLAQGAPPQGGADQPYTMEYYYKVQWGHQQEFLQLFLKNHYPLLEKIVESG